MEEIKEITPEIFADRVTALGESEMQMLRFLIGRPTGVILTTETDRILAQLLAADDLVEMPAEDKVIVPDHIRGMFRDIVNDELILQWRKRNWMYKCLEAGKYLYGVMTWEVLGQLFALRYPHAESDEIRHLFEATPSGYQWFTERGDRLVLNGFEKDDYYKYLEQNIQRNVPFYIPSKEEIETLYEQGSLIDREAHAKLQDFIVETFYCDKDVAALRIHELYEAVNNRVRVNDAVELFASGSDSGREFRFPNDEAEVRFIELYIDMSRECRIRDNRGHDYYEMVGIMAGQNRSADTAGSGKKQAVKRVKIGRNEPCPCGSGKKYKNCCGRNA